MKNIFLKIEGNDTKILAVPRKHVEELRDVTEDKMSATDAHQDMFGRYTIANTVANTVANPKKKPQESDLHRRTIQPNMKLSCGTLVAPNKDELDCAFNVETFDYKNWTLSHLNVAHSSTSISVDAKLPYNNKWLFTRDYFTKNDNLTRRDLRILPVLAHPVIARLLASYWRIYSNLGTATTMASPIIAERRAAAERKPRYKSSSDFLQWIVDNSTTQDGSPNELAHRQFLITLVSVLREVEPLVC